MQQSWSNWISHCWFKFTDFLRDRQNSAAPVHTHWHTFLDKPLWTGLIGTYLFWLAEMIKSVWSHISLQLQSWQHVNLLWWNKMAKREGWVGREEIIRISWKSNLRRWHDLTAYVDRCTVLAEVCALLSAIFFTLFITHSGNINEKCAKLTLSCAYFCCVLRGVNVTACASTAATPCRFGVWF